MLQKGVSKTTIGVVLRSLRTIFNEAIESGKLKREKHYPFGRRKYQIPTSRNLKKALDIETIQKIYEYNSSCKSIERARDLWLFCFLANGMNVKDMLYLKYKNIEGEFLIFERAKTERTSRSDPKLITVYLTQDLVKIIEKWGNTVTASKDYLFPFMRDGLNSLEQFDLLNFVRSYINDSMQKIRLELGIEKKLTSIVSRHTFSTLMKRAGASTEFIQEALGHADKKTTENYLDSFEKEMKKEFASKLLSFKEQGRI
jgi:integrase